MTDYDPADNSRRGYDVALAALRDTLVFVRHPSPEIELVISGSTPGVYLLSPEKALDLGSQLVQMACSELRARNGRVTEPKAVCDGGIPPESSLDRTG